MEHALVRSAQLDADTIQVDVEGSKATLSAAFAPGQKNRKQNTPRGETIRELR